MRRGPGWTGASRCRWPGRPETCRNRTKKGPEIGALSRFGGLSDHEIELVCQWQAAGTLPGQIEQRIGISTHAPYGDTVQLLLVRHALPLRSVC